MSGVVLVNQVVFLVATWALLSAGYRSASAAGASGAECVLAAIVVAAALAVAEVMLLGLVNLSGNRLALTVVVAIASWLVVRLALAAPRARIAGEVTARVRAAGLWLILPGVTAGLIIALMDFVLVHPFLGVDALDYHIPEALIYVQNAHAGPLSTVHEVLPAFPVTGYYPLTNEVLLAWAMALSGTLVPAALLGPAQLAVLVGAAWVGLRRLGSGGVLAALAIAAFCLSPDLLFSQGTGPTTDLPTMMWLVIAGALGVGARDSPRLLAFSLLALALALGTKTTAAVTVLAMLVAGGVCFRLHIRRQALALGIALAVGLLVGGYWYLRNLAVNGSPLWPFVTFPWGTPAPPGVVLWSFLHSPGRLVSQFGGDYLKFFLPDFLLLAAGLVAALLSRRRAALLVALVAAIGGLAWLNAPATGGVVIHGVEVPGIAASTLRYLFPAVATATVALVLAARNHRLQLLAGLILAVAVGLDLYRVYQFHGQFPRAPALLVGAVGGAVIAMLMRWISVRRLWFAAAFLGAISAVAVTLAAKGFVARHAQTRTYDAPLAGYLDRQPGFVRGRTVAMAGGVSAVLAGDYLQNRVVPLSASAHCATTRRYARKGWVIAILYFPRAAEAAARCLTGIPPTIISAFAIYTAGTSGQRAK